MTTQYTREQVEDITKREAQGLEALKALHLTPASIIQKVNIGNDTFADKMIAYLADIKYSAHMSNSDAKTEDAPIEEVKTEDAPITEENASTNIG